VRWLLILVLAFVLGCATVQGQGNFIDELMKAPTESADRRFIKEKGWTPLHANGNTWNLYVVEDGHLVVLAQCRYQYVKIQGVEMWMGSYFAGRDDLNPYGHYLIVHDLENLSGCVEWVEHQVLGDYFI
jgi:predicted small secreted protein